MFVRHVPLDRAQEKALKIGLKFVPSNVLSPVEYTGVLKFNGGGHVYQRGYYGGDGNWHWLRNAVCWHGYDEWFAAVFADYPDALIRTASAVYMGRKGYEVQRGAAREVYINQECACTRATVLT